MIVVELPLSRLKENHWNPNRMDERTFNSLVRAIKEKGFLQPILVCRYRGSEAYQVIDGAHRLRAARKAGMESVPCVLIEAEDEEEAKLKTVMLNKLRGKFDVKELAQILSEFDIERAENFLAFTEKEYKDLLSLLDESPPSIKECWVARPPLKVVIEFLSDECSEIEIEKTIKEAQCENSLGSRGEALLFLCRFWRENRSLPRQNATVSDTANSLEQRKKRRGR
ncbi:MAG: ParB/RepB/Spo0J family partition protein [Planctomycetota bacterium]|nr:ParB/RepB/Spo0J family partition protein [Planctomycetota bacterium]